jgi:hypothetical protein
LTQLLLDTHPEGGRLADITSMLRRGAPDSQIKPAIRNLGRDAEVAEANELHREKQLVGLEKLGNTPVKELMKDVSYAALRKERIEREEAFETAKKMYKTLRGR